MVIPVIFATLITFILTNIVHAFPDHAINLTVLTALISLTSLISLKT